MNSSFRLQIPLTQSNQIIAQQLGQKSHPGQRRQIIHNILAVYAVHNYLELLGIESSPIDSELFRSTIQSLPNVGDLQVKNLGKLECRGIAASDEKNSKSYDVPPEACTNRIGYIFVTVNESFNQAEIIGFTKSITENPFPIEKLKPAEELIAQLHKLS
ncbi:DUF1822 family protein [Leptolyngbya sp. AN03gr2]|uniref:DUF1822 family protein n=1 Tax=unclassified Leptolyngbya TaxID=2650499 RepID=UPI003D310647